jgi:hypothetical protein
MSSAPPSALSTELIVVAIIALVLLRRTYGQLTGARYSSGRLFGFAGFYVLIFAIFGFGTIYAAIATWGSVAYALLVPYALVPIGVAFLATPFVERIVHFERRDDGQLYYQLPWHVPVLYLVLFIARIGAEIAVYGSSAFNVPPPAPPTVLDLVILVVVDLLFATSLGLLVGRGLGVYRAHAKLPATEGAPPSPPSPPLPSS